MLRVRFQANFGDPRPIHWPIKHPYWVSGWAGDESSATIISYAEDDQYIFTNWPEAENLDIQEVEGYIFTDRFPKPSWFKDEQHNGITQEADDGKVTQ
jgi:hypothetical protein